MGQSILKIKLLEILIKTDIVLKIVIFKMLINLKNLIKLKKGFLKLKLN